MEFPAEKKLVTVEEAPWWQSKRLWTFVALLAVTAINLLQQGAAFIPSDVMQWTLWAANGALAIANLVLLVWFGERSIKAPGKR